MPETRQYSPIFDARTASSFGWLGVNTALADENPAYHKRHGEVGSESWWEHYDAAMFDVRHFQGTVTFLGEREDEFGEVRDEIDITPDRGRVCTYDRCGYWEDGRIRLGMEVEIDTVHVVVSERLGRHEYIIETLVKIGI